MEFRVGYVAIPFEIQLVAGDRAFNDLCSPQGTLWHQNVSRRPRRDRNIIKQTPTATQTQIMTTDCASSYPHLERGHWGWICHIYGGDRRESQGGWGWSCCVYGGGDWNGSQWDWGWLCRVYGGWLEGVYGCRMSLMGRTKGGCYFEWWGTKTTTATNGNHS